QLMALRGVCVAIADPHGSAVISVFCCYRAAGVSVFETGCSAVGQTPGRSGGLRTAFGGGGGHGEPGAEERDQRSDDQVHDFIKLARGKVITAEEIPLNQEDGDDQAPEEEQGAER